MKRSLIANHEWQYIQSNQKGSSYFGKANCIIYEKNDTEQRRVLSEPPFILSKFPDERAVEPTERVEFSNAIFAVWAK